MQKLIKNTLATTGLTLIVLAIIASIYQAELLCISSIYESLAVNIIIQLGITLINKFESKYFFMEILLENGFVLTVLMIAGYSFHWYNSMPVWVLALMGVVIYGISYAIHSLRIHDDIDFINTQLNNQR